jgi:hypothetical protein
LYYRNKKHSQGTLVKYGSSGWVAASKPKALGMVNTGEAIPNPFDLAQGSAALEAATLPSYQIKVDKLLVGVLQFNSTHYLLSFKLFHYLEHASYLDTDLPGEMPAEPISRGERRFLSRISYPSTGLRTS